MTLPFGWRSYSAGQSLGSLRSNTPSQQTSNSSSFSITRSNNGTNGYSSSRQTASYSNGGVELEDGGRSFLQDRSKVSGFADVMGRMAATDAVEGSAESDEQARSLLNRFLGAQVLLTGVESMMANSNGGGQMSVTESRSSSSATEEKRSQAASTTSGDPLELVKGVDINSEFDEDTLRKLLDSCDAYEDRRKVRQRLKNITASAKGGVSGSGVASTQGASKRGGARDSDKGSSSSSSLRTTQGPRSDSRSNSQASTFSSSFSSQSSKMTKVSPFNKFQQLDAQQPTTRRARE